MSQKYNLNKVLLIGDEEDKINEIKDRLGSLCYDAIVLSGDDIGEEYLVCSKKILNLYKMMIRKLHGKEGLLQVCLCVKEKKQKIFEGLGAFLTTMHLENKELFGQLIIIEEGETDKVQYYLEQESKQKQDVYICYKNGKRMVRIIEEAEQHNNRNDVNLWKDGGVYLITGGAGGIGSILIEEIKKYVTGATVVITGRSSKDKNSFEDSKIKIDYIQSDITKESSVKQLFEYIKTNYGHLDGIIHAAGVIRDHIIPYKKEDEVEEVIRPKANGLYNIDKMTVLYSNDLKPDFLILMSSSAAVMGNIGQADYAIANGFLDNFAQYRNLLLESGKRNGRTYSINWPLWENGGMTIDKDIEASIYNTTGMAPMKVEDAIQIMYNVVSSGLTNVMPLQGNKDKIKNWVINNNEKDDSKSVVVNKQEIINLNNIKERFISWLKTIFSKELALSVEKIDERVPLDNYGLNSIMVMNLTHKLEEYFGNLSKTLFFEYDNIKEISDYFCGNFIDKIKNILGIQYKTTTVDEDIEEIEEIEEDEIPNIFMSMQEENYKNEVNMDIAVIGIAGQYPKADNLDVLWDNLKQGKDCITEIPKDRWDHSKYYDADKTKSDKTYAKWGGFLDNIECFDPMFFNISPIEAEGMDPQERLFLQCVYHAMEDAGYTRDSIDITEKHEMKNNVGVYVGVMYEEYQLYGAQAQQRGNMYTLNGSEASIANRISYTFGFHGPSMSVDSMCSSSLTAVHLACQAILNGECKVAIAGGVNLSLHPNKFLMLGQSRFMSSKGRCETFGEGGDGYVPGEGVGAIILKPLKKAQEDGDHIYGVIKGSAVNHGGKTSGYTVPNPKAQAGVIKEAWKRAGINPTEISYIEAHGTGTSLGDPIEISGLNQAYKKFTNKKQFCDIGSIKSNIGHCESAAGIAGITKILLQMKYGKIVPSIHSKVLNSNIDFKNSPFIVPQSVKDWKRPKTEDGKVCPRIAGVSAFGAGGTNAHIVLEEYVDKNKLIDNSRKYIPLILISARTDEQLNKKIQELLDWTYKNENENVTDIAYTLMTGREAMEKRIAFFANSIEDIQCVLKKIINKESVEIYKGEINNSNDIIHTFESDNDIDDLIGKWIDNEKYVKVAELWTKGLNINWQKYFSPSLYHRKSMPGYPFAKEKYWGPDRKNKNNANADVNIDINSLSINRIYPVIGRNTSDFTEQRYTTIFNENESFLEGHVIGGRKILPAVIFMEMVQEALMDCMHLNLENWKVFNFKELVWMRACVIQESDLPIHVGLRFDDNNDIKFNIYSGNIETDEEFILYCTGIVSFDAPKEAIHYEIDKLKEEHTLSQADAIKVYNCFNEMNMVYGESQRGINTLYKGNKSVLSHIILPESMKSESEEYILNPSIMDSAIQSSIGLSHSNTLFGDNEYVKDENKNPSVPYMIKSMTVYKPCTDSMWAYVRTDDNKNIDEISIDICDSSGDVCISIDHILYRKVKKLDVENREVMLKTEWHILNDEMQINNKINEKKLILCDFGKNVKSEIVNKYKGKQCLFINSDSESLSKKYIEIACMLFKILKQEVRENKGKQEQIQVVVPADGEVSIMEGLLGILKTTNIEKPDIACQMIIVDRKANSDEIVQVAKNAEKYLQYSIIRYKDGKYSVLSYVQVEKLLDEYKAFADKEVYLITGGVGELGIAFAKEIAQNTNDAVVILTGRSDLSNKKKEKINSIKALGIECVYFKSDITNVSDVEQLVKNIMNKYNRLDGIIHSAGIIRDNYIYNKDESEFLKVLDPKVKGAVLLDEVTKDIKLKFFVMFSSLTSVLGNAGQADYAAANGFLDSFMKYRYELVKKGKRYGKSISINWPLWKQGGMSIDSSIVSSMSNRSGISLLEVQDGISMFYKALSLGYSEIVALTGDSKKILSIFDIENRNFIQSKNNEVVSVSEVRDNENLKVKMLNYLKDIFFEVLQIPKSKIESNTHFEKYGIDSILVMKLIERMEKDFGAMSKTLLFEYQTLQQLAQYFLENKLEKVETMFGEKYEVKVPDKKEERYKSKKEIKFNSNRLERIRITEKENDDIAIIGVSGKYPMSNNLEGFWNNLKNGRDCITEIPKNRWNNSLYFDSEKGKIGKTYSKWGGFLDDIEMFDPIFFKIPPIEAEFLDPQERLFLETVWQALEDSAYTRESLAKEKVGVFTGVMYALYQLYETNQYGEKITGRSSMASIANRISYFFDFKGPSIALDTMCSSSLTAIYLACESIKSGACTMAVAGGVNLSLHPNKYIQLCQGGFLSTDGKCRSFGEGGNGYVPGEGVGAIILKPLSKAEQDGDNIYGVIKAVAINSGGKTSGYTVPNLNAQRDLIKETLSKANIDPRTISYIETHGTGTSLGDPIEIDALTQAFDNKEENKQYCAIGSVKSNIGHLESAAGMASITKVILQMKHKQLVPSLHSENENPYINLKDTPFYLQHKFSKWERPIVDGKEVKRRAGISAFGAGGSNAHLILEEYDDTRNYSSNDEEECLFILSANSKERLKIYAKDLLNYLKDISEPKNNYDIQETVKVIVAESIGIEKEDINIDDDFSETGIDPYKLEDIRIKILDKINVYLSMQEILECKNIGEVVSSINSKLEKLYEFTSPQYSLADISYTLEIGRENMDERLAIISSNYTTLKNSLENYINDKDGDYLTGNINGSKEKFAGILDDDGMQTYARTLLKQKKWREIAELYILGVKIDWNIVYEYEKHKKVSLPHSPLLKVRCWITPENKEKTLFLENVKDVLKPQPEGTLNKVEKNSFINTVEVPENINLKDGMIEYLKKTFMNLLKIPYEFLSASKDYESYGIDSIHISKINQYLGQNFGKIPSTLLFTYKTIDSLASYFVNNYKDKVQEIIFGEKQEVSVLENKDSGSTECENINANIDIEYEENLSNDNDIAIIGMSGVFPQSNTLDEYFKNLEEGKDCITTIPAERWDYKKYPTVKCKWGGFINDVDKFDPQFFHIAPVTANFMDPQERLFIESVWSCMEDAGYTPKSMKNKALGDSRANVSVFAGVTFNEYGLYGAENIARGKGTPLNSQIYSIANRVSYLFNFGGPSLSVDTACSSSLYAVHLGCESIRNGQCDMAIAGGVNLSIHPSKYLTLDWTNFLASDGHCRTFGKGGDGYVPGEGTGAVLLKSLRKAEEDNDHIYAIIKGSAVNHGGKTYGFSVPNPVAQTEVIEEAIKMAHINPRTISYVEAHGTGTALGDPIEITALTEAYKKYTNDLQFCSIGSVKSNIGHLEAASGISQLIKVILQMQHKELVPSRLNSNELNPNIDFENTPFYVQLEKAEWKRPILGSECKEEKRRAGISSFGVGGVNVHMIIEEYEEEKKEETTKINEPAVILISARKEHTLKKYVKSWLDFIEDKKESLPDIHNVAYTTQVGRISLSYRLALVVNNYDELRDALKGYLNGIKNENILFGQVIENKNEELDYDSSINNVVQAANYWISGKDVPFNVLYKNIPMRKVSLPNYPYEKERYWMFEKSEYIIEETVKIEKQENKNKESDNIIDKIHNAYETEKLEIIIKHIQNMFAELLVFNEGILPDVNEGFFDLGLESVAIRNSCNIIEEDFGIELDEQVFFDYPNITELSKFILSKINLKLEKENGNNNKDLAIKTLYLKPEWKLTEALTYSEESKFGKVLFFDMDNDSTEYIHKKVSKAEWENFKFYKSGAQLTRGTSENFAFYKNGIQLTKKVKNELNNCEKIVFIEGMSNNTQSSISEQIENGILKIFNIVKEVVTKNISIIYIYVDRGDNVSAENGAMYGFFKTINTEHSNFKFKSIKVEPEIIEKKKLGSIILNELMDECSEEEILYLNNLERYKRKLTEILNSDKSKGILLKEKGIYLITGATGGLATLFSKYLANTYHANLILVGRREISEKMQDTINYIESVGGSAIYIKADISNERQVKDLIKEAKNKYGSINGIIHTAGVIRDARIENKNKKDIKEVLAAKVQGTQYLDIALKDEKLEFFLMFSSLASVMGNVGQCDYCYANSFMDHFAEVRNDMVEKGERSGKTCSINWSFWKNGGMNIDKDSEKWMKKKTGLVLMEDEVGIDAFENVMKFNYSQVVLLNGIEKKIRKVLNLPEIKALEDESYDVENKEIVELDELNDKKFLDEVDNLNENEILDLLTKEIDLE